VYTIVVVKKSLIIAIVLVLAVAALGGYFLFGKNIVSISQQTTQTEQNSQNPSTLKELLTSSITRQCSFKESSDDVDTTGVVYVAGGKMRGDYDNVQGGKTAKMHMLVMNNYTYIWTDGQTKGYKMLFNPESTSETSSPSASTNQEQVDLDRKIDVNCSTWVADGTVFELPGGIEFMDISSMAQPAQPSMSNQQESTASSLQGATLSKSLHSRI
jgi:hypothetical protein